MKFIKKNKYTIIVVLAFVLLVFIGAKAMDLFFPNTGKAIYGNRLDGIEKVKIKNSKMDEVVGKIKEDGMVSKVEDDINGRLVNFIITVNDDVNVGDAKTLADKAISSFEEDQKKFYDFQVLIKKENKELTDFPIIGYRHHDNTNFSWTKDRAGA